MDILSHNLKLYSAQPEGVAKVASQLDAQVKAKERVGFFLHTLYSFGLMYPENFMNFRLFLRNLKRKIPNHLVSASVPRRTEPISPFYPLCYLLFLVLVGLSSER